MSNIIYTSYVTKHTDSIVLTTSFEDVINKIKIEELSGIVTVIAAGLLQATTLSAFHPDHRYPPNGPIESVTDDTILILNSIRLKLINIHELSDFNKVTIQTLSFWNLINGPLADTLTHIGQINMIKRALDKPVRKSSMLKGIFKSEEII